MSITINLSVREQIRAIYKVMVAEVAIYNDGTIVIQPKDYKNQALGQHTAAAAGAATAGIPLAGRFERVQVEINSDG